MHLEYILRWINKCWTGSKVGKFIGTTWFQTIQIEWRHSNIYTPSMVHSFRSSSPWIEWLSYQNNFGLRANSTFPCLKYVEHWGRNWYSHAQLNSFIKSNVESFVRLIARVLFMPGYFSPYHSLSHSPALAFAFSFCTLHVWTLISHKQAWNTAVHLSRKFHYVVHKKSRKRFV